MTTENKVIIKNKILIYHSGQPSLVQRKLYNVLIFHCYKLLTDDSVLEFKVPIKKIIDCMGYAGEINRKRFIADCESLMTCFVRWNILGADAITNQYGTTSLLHTVEVKNGFVYYEMSRKMRNLLASNPQYIKIRLDIQNLFTSKYSMALYELSKAFYREKHLDGETSWFTISKLKEHLGLNSYDYDVFNDFRRYVLSTAVNEINAITDLKISLDFRKDGRKINEIKIRIKPNTENKHFSKNLEVTLDQEILSSDFPILSEPNQEIISDLANLGISQNKALELLKEYSLDLIKDKILLTKDNVKGKKIKSSASGFLLKALENNYSNDSKKFIEAEERQERLKNPQSYKISPLEYASLEEMEKHVNKLEQDGYRAGWLASDLELAEKKWLLSSRLTLA